MNTKNKFEESNVVIEAFKPLGARYKFNNDSIETTKERVNDLIDAISITGYTPEIVVHSSWITNDNGDFVEAAFTVKPAARANSKAPKYKLSFHVLANEYFYSNFCYNLARWADGYALQTRYQENLDELQAVFDESLTAAEVPFEVKLELGKGVIDVSDTSITLGIPHSVVADLATNDLFYSMIPGNLEVIRAKLDELVKTCAKPIDIVKLNSYIFKSLGIYSRKGYKSLIRDIVTRRVQYSRVGESYVDTPDYFAVISKVAVTEEEAAKYEGAYVVDNATATKAEIAAGKSKIVISYKLSPFNTDGATVDVDIKSIEGIAEANKKA